MYLNWDKKVEVRLSDGSAIEYVYGVEGIRVSTTVDGITTHYLVDKNRPYAQVLYHFSKTLREMIDQKA